MFMTVYSVICFEDRVRLLKGVLKYVLALISATEEQIFCWPQGWHFITFPSLFAACTLHTLPGVGIDEVNEAVDLENRGDPAHAAEGLRKLGGEAHDGILCEEI